MKTHVLTDVKNSAKVSQHLAFKLGSKEMFDHAFYFIHQAIESSSEKSKTLSDNEKKHSVERKLSPIEADEKMVYGADFAVGEQKIVLLKPAADDKVVRPGVSAGVATLPDTLNRV